MTIEKNIVSSTNWECGDIWGDWDSQTEMLSDNGNIIQEETFLSSFVIIVLSASCGREKGKWLRPSPVRLMFSEQNKFVSPFMALIPSLTTWSSPFSEHK